MKNKVYILIFFIYIFFSVENFCEINMDKIIYKQEINISDTDLSDFLFFLSKEGNIEIISENSIKNEKVDIFCHENTSLKKILEIVCDTHNFRYENRKDYIIIVPKNIKSEKNGNISGKILSLNSKRALENVKITLVDNYSKPCYSDKGGIFRFENIPYGSYFLRVEKEGYIVEGEFINVNKHDNIINIFMEDEIQNKKVNGFNSTKINNNFIIEKIKFSDIDTVDFENILPQELREGIKFFKNSDKRILYISGKEERVLKIKKYFEELDSHNKQVRITAQILDVTDNLFEELGFSWLYGGNSENREENGISTGILTNSSVMGMGSIFSSVFGLVRNFNNDEEFIKMSFNLLQGTQDLTISAVPSIVTTSGREGIFRITEEKIIGHEKVENDDNGKTTYTPIFKEAGIILKVVPEIMKDNNIVLNINLETSDFKMQDYVDDSNNEYGDSGGSKVSRNIETTVRLKDGDTVFIGGLKKGIIQNSESRVPFISSVPVIGSVFKNSSERKEITDLYIRLKVDVVKDGSFSDSGMDTFYGVKNKNIN